MQLDQTCATMKILTTRSRATADVARARARNQAPSELAPFELDRRVLLGHSCCAHGSRVVSMSEMEVGLISLRDAGVAQSFGVFVSQSATQRTKIVHRLQSARTGTRSGSTAVSKCERDEKSSPTERLCRSRVQSVPCRCALRSPRCVRTLDSVSSTCCRLSVDWCSAGFGTRCSMPGSRPFRRDDRSACKESTSEAAHSD